MGYITVNNTAEGAIQDIEVFGNTVQSSTNLADIQSVGTLREDGLYEMSISSCGKNLTSLANIWETFNSTVNGISNSSYDGSILTLNWNGTIREAILVKGCFKSNTQYSLSFWCKGISGTWQRSMIRFKYTDGTVSNLSAGGTSSTEFTKQTLISEQSKTVSSIEVYLNNGIQINQVQLEEGTVATQYEEYKHNKSSILLPYQLEKVGDVKDRLYYDKSKKAWCVDKYIDTKIFNGEESGWRVITDAPNQVETLCIGDVKISDNVVVGDNTVSLLINNRFKNYTWTGLSGMDVEGVSIASNKCIRLRISKTKANNLSSSLEWIRNNNLMVKYKLTTPQKIILPLDTQIQLNSFFGTTHIFSEDTVIEPTIKAKVSKSLSASVSSLNNKTDILKDRLDKIEGLQDSANFKYVTSKGYINCENTNNGQIDKLKLEGKTLVNLCKTTGNKAINSNSNQVFTLGLNSNLLANRTYTIGFEISSYTGTNAIKFGQTKLDNSSYYQNSTLLNKGNGIHFVNFTPELEYKQLRIYFDTNTEIISSATVGNVVILEGDHTQNPPNGYFEGIKSVGEDVSEIEVLSVKSDGNLFDGEFIKGNYQTTGNGLFETSDITICSKDKIRVIPNTKYKFMNDKNYNIAIRYYDYKGNIVLSQNSSGNGTRIEITPSNCCYVNVVLVGTDLNTNFGIFRNDVTPHYEVTKQHKKRILYYNESGELVAVPQLREWDSVYEENGKTYYKCGSGQVTFDGSEDWNIYNGGTKVNCINFNTPLELNAIRNTVKCNLFNYGGLVSWDWDSENITTSIDRAYITILRSKLSTQDVQGFKTWLQSNPVTVVYQLAEPKIYECINLDLDSYSNETLVLCDSGAISPTMEFEITSHIGNTVNVMKKRIKFLEEKVYNYVTNQNLMMLETRYMSDTNNFAISTYNNTARTVSNVDERLYNLILDIIEVGKENYNREWMEEVISFYWMDFKIDDEMYNELSLMIELQYNPPIIEIEETVETPVEE